MSTVVVDAAAVVDVICDLSPGQPVRSRLRTASSIHAPAHVDAEVLSALGRLHRAGQLTHPAARVEALSAFRADRWPLAPLGVAAWALTDQIATRDSLYVALAQSLNATLITTDMRLRAAARGLVATE